MAEAARVQEVPIPAREERRVLEVAEAVVVETQFAVVVAVV
jgi:hypothetical protein